MKTKTIDPKIEVVLGKDVEEGEAMYAKAIEEGAKKRKSKTPKIKLAGYHSPTQQKNVAWMLPRPKKDRYKGGMPLYAEEWIIQLCRDILQNQEASVLNIFCGMNSIGTRVDIKPEVNPDVCCDVHELTKHIKEKFDIIFADPPYSDEEARVIYGTPKLKYKKWTKEATELLNPGGLLVVYHKYLMPNPDPNLYVVAKRIFIGNRVYHLPRAAIVFQKKA